MNPDMNPFSRSLDSGFLTEVDVILWVWLRAVEWIGCRELTLCAYVNGAYQCFSPELTRV